jgi:hypothetical protein
MLEVSLGLTVIDWQRSTSDTIEVRQQISADTDIYECAKCRIPTEDTRIYKEDIVIVVIEPVA